jgi:plastocyanin
MKGAVPLALALAAVCARPAAAADRTVVIPGRFFSPGSLSVLAGDSVTWTNDDFFRHALAAVDGSFASGPLDGGATFSHVFDTPGTFAYVCTLHPFMTGRINVFAFALRGPERPTPVGRAATLTGTTPPGTNEVAIEQRLATGGFQPLGSARADAHGMFRYAVVPSGPTTYRAVAGGEASLSLRLPVSARLELVARRRGDGRLALSAIAAPAQPGAPAVLQIYSRKRSAWRAAARGQLDARSTVTFSVRAARRLRVRVALLRGVRGYAPAVSSARTIRTSPVGAR